MTVRPVLGYTQGPHWRSMEFGILLANSIYVIIGRSSLVSVSFPASLAIHGIHMAS